MSAIAGAGGMRLLPPEIEAILTTANLLRLAWAIGFLFVGYIGLKIFLFFLGRSLERRISAQSTMIVRKVVIYAGMTVLVLIVLAQFGISMAALLGAAGILGIGLGFAAQTSLSNMISGVFLISEKAFAVGDLITLGETTGFILSIDLLSVKLRTLDNRFVRVPNESIIKSEVVNITRFPIRRMDLDFTVAQGTDLAIVREVAVGVVGELPECLDDPEPLFLIQKVSPLGYDVRLGVWFPRDQFLAVRNGVLALLVRRLEEGRIELAKYPFVNEPRVS